MLVSKSTIMFQPQWFGAVLWATDGFYVRVGCIYPERHNYGCLVALEAGGVRQLLETAPDVIDRSRATRGYI